MKHEIAERIKNFRWNSNNFEQKEAESERFFFDLDILKDIVIQFSNLELINRMDRPEALHKIFSQIYRTIRLPGIDRRLFDDYPPLSNSVFEACFFSTLCAYLNSSKRIKGMSLRNFALHYAPGKLDDIESSNFHTNLLDSSSDDLRKARNRMLKNGPTYIKNIRWGAIPKDAIHEWTFFYELESASKDVQVTYKRMGNLFLDVYKALDADKGSDYLNQAYGKFLSKLRKIKYEKYLDLQREILSHINKDKEYYGLNIYRLERRQMPYAIIGEVKKLSAYKSEDAAATFLMKSAILKDISYPKIREALFAMSIDDAARYGFEFCSFLQGITVSSCLILDELVEQGILGDDWEKLFISEINKRYKDVLYDSDELDFSITEDPQEQFELLLNAPVFLLLRDKIGMPVCASELLSLSSALI